MTDSLLKDELAARPLRTLGKALEDYQDATSRGYIITADGAIHLTVLDRIERSARVIKLAAWDASRMCAAERRRQLHIVAAHAA